MSRLSGILAWLIIPMYIALKVADITIVNLDAPRYFLIKLFPYYCIPIALFSILCGGAEYFKRTSLFFLLPIAILLFNGDIRPLTSLILLIFLIPIYGIFLENISLKRLILILILIIILIISDYIQSRYYGTLFWGYYGRERLLLGIFHPKDQAYLIIYVYLLLAWVLHRERMILFMLYILSLFALYLTDSRGPFLGLIIFGLVSYFSERFLKYIVAISILLLIYILFNNSFEDLNILSSNRLNIWIDIYNQNINPTNSIDSSFLYFGYGNILGFYLIALWLIYAFMISHNCFYNKLKYFYLIITLGIFDVGLFSFSNMVGLHCWTVCLLNEKNKS